MKLPGGAIVKGVMAISAGTALAQLVTMGASPIISRIYSPGEMGIFTTVASVSAIIAPLASLRWDFAIPIPDDDADAHSLVMLGMVSIVCVTATLTIAGAIFGDDICSALNEPRLMPWILVAPVIGGLAGAMKVLNQLAVRHRRYRAIGSRTMFRAVVMSVAQVLLGLLGMRAGGLALGLAIGNGAGAASLLRGSKLRSAEARRGRSTHSLRRYARTYRRFPLILAPSGILNVLGLQLPILLVFALYGSRVAGWLGLTQSVLGLPVALLGQSVAQVYLGELARSKRQGGKRQLHLFDRASRSLCAVGLVLAVVLIVLGPFLFPLVFGANWVPSGQYARALGPSLGLQMLAVPLSQTLIVFGRQGTQLAWDASRVLITSGVVIICARMDGSPLVAIWLLSLASALTYLLLWLTARRILHSEVVVARPTAANAEDNSNCGW